MMNSGAYTNVALVAPLVAPLFVGACAGVVNLPVNHSYLAPRSISTQSASLRSYTPSSRESLTPVLQSFYESLTLQQVDPSDELLMVIEENFEALLCRVA